jgi:hypothetical protein
MDMQKELKKRVSEIEEIFPEKKVFKRQFWKQ